MFPSKFFALSGQSPELLILVEGLTMPECLGDIFVGNDCADPKSDCRSRLEADTVTIFLSGRFLDEPESNDFVAIPEEFDCLIICGSFGAGDEGEEIGEADPWGESCWAWRDAFTED